MTFKVGDKVKCIPGKDKSEYGNRWDLEADKIYTVNNPTIWNEYIRLGGMDLNFVESRFELANTDPVEYIIELITKWEKVQTNDPTNFKASFFIPEYKNFLEVAYGITYTKETITTTTLAFSNGNKSVI